VYTELRELTLSQFVTQKPDFGVFGAFWQLHIKHEHRWKAAFVTHHGVWQWKRMPFGLRNAQGTFVRLMRTLLHPIRDSSEAYIDDSYTFSCDFDLHCEHLRKFLTVIRNAGLTLNLSKCQFAQICVSVVGYIVGGGRFFPDPLNVESIMSMKEPQTKIEVRRALGIFSFYRNHVEGFARIAKLLTDLTGSDSERARGIPWEFSAEIVGPV